MECAILVVSLMNHRNKTIQRTKAINVAFKKVSLSGSCLIRFAIGGSAEEATLVS